MIQLNGSVVDQLGEADLRKRKIFISSSFTKCCICPIASDPIGDWDLPVGHVPCPDQHNNLTLLHVTYIGFAAKFEASNIHSLTRSASYQLFR